MKNRSGSLQHTIISTGLFVMCAGVALAQEAPQGPVAMTPGQRQLFLDDWIIQEMQGLERRMHTPEKRGAVVKPDIPSDGRLIQVRSAPMWIPEEQIYKMVYIACPIDAPDQIGSALATSKDGLHWEKPKLGLVEVLGSKDNNRFDVDPTLTWPRNAFENVIYDGADPDPSRRYKGLLGAENRVPVVSADCLHWRRLDSPPLTSSDESELVYDGARKRFMAMLKTGNEYGRAFAISTSEDFQHWAPNRFLFGADAEDQKRAPDIIRAYIANPNVVHPVFVDPDPATGWQSPAGKPHQPTWRMECYNIAVFPYEGVYVAMPMTYFPTGTSLPAANNTDGFDLIQLAMTRDLEHWVRLGDRQPFIGPSSVEHGRVGVFDRIQLVPTNHPIEHGDELWFYYTGLKWRDVAYEVNADGSPRDPATLTPEERADQAEGWGAVCLAVLRKDGFVSLDAKEQEGTVLTRPIRLAGAGLFMNVDARDGSLAVEICDEAGAALPGYAAADAQPATGDAIRAQAQWRAGGSIQALANRVVRLRFHLTRASLYAFWTE